MAPPRRRALGTVDAYADAFTQVDLAVRNVRVLARGARRAIDLEDNVPPEICTALRALAAAVRALHEALEDPEREEAVRVHALRAAGASAEVLERTGNLSATVMVGQIRSTAVDLLRGSGMTYEEAAEAVRTGGVRAPGIRGSRELRRSGVRPGLVRLAGRAPERRAPADRVARAAACRSAGRRRRGARCSISSPVCTPPLRIAERVAARSDAAQRVELRLAQVARRPARGEPGAPQRLVGQQVADAGDRALVEQAGLERRRPAADAAPEGLAADLARRRARRARSPARGSPARGAACRAARAARRRRTRARTGPSCPARADGRRRSARPCPDAGPGSARRRRSRPRGTCRAGASGRAGGRRAPRRSPRARAGGRRRCRGRRPRRSRGPARGRSAAARVRPRGARASYSPQRTSLRAIPRGGYSWCRRTACGPSLRPARRPGTAGTARTRRGSPRRSAACRPRRGRRCRPGTPRPAGRRSPGRRPPTGVTSTSMNSPLIPPLRSGRRRGRGCPRSARRP